MPQVTFTPPTVGLPGQPAGRIGDIDSALYPARGQVTTVTVDATVADGTYYTRITLPDGRYFEGSFVAASSNATAVAAGLKTSLDAIAGLKGIMTSVAAAAVLTLTFRDVGSAYTVTHVGSPTGDIASALTTDAVRTLLPLGTMACKLSDGTCRAPASGDVAATLTGLVVRSDAEILPQFFPELGDGYQAGRLVPLAINGDYWVDVEGAVAWQGAAFARIVATGAQVFGALRADADSATAVAIRGTFQLATTGAGRSILRLHLPSTV